MRLVEQFLVQRHHYSCPAVDMIPFYIYYSLFGVPTVAIRFWAAADMRAKGFLVEALRGRTHSNAKACSTKTDTACFQRDCVPDRRLPTTPRLATKFVVIVAEELEAMFRQGDGASYYHYGRKTKQTSTPKWPEGCEEGIIKRMYNSKSVKASDSTNAVNCSASRCEFLNSAIKPNRASPKNTRSLGRVERLTSYTATPPRSRCLANERTDCTDRTPRAATSKKPRRHVERTIHFGSDYVRALGEQLTTWIPGELIYVLDRWHGSQRNPRNATSALRKSMPNRS